MRSLAARSPLRISFAGGGTDVEPFSKTYGSSIVSATINLYAEVSVTWSDGEGITVHSIDTGERLSLTAWNDEELKSHLISACGLILPTHQRKGLDITFTSPVAPGSGLGASSALVVAMVKVLSATEGEEYSASRLASEALNIERTQMKIAGGFQDQYASAYGGLNYIECDPRGVHVTPLQLSRDFLLELESNLILANLSLPRQGQHIIEDQQRGVVNRNNKVLAATRKQLVLGRQMYAAFLNEDPFEIGKLMNESWEAKRDFSEKVSTPRIDEIMSKLKTIPVLGAKITGAGGGGHILILVNRSRRQLVKDYLESIEIKVRDFAFTNEGAVSWKM